LTAVNLAEDAAIRCADGRGVKGPACSWLAGPFV
jgi:hypothetical protein